MYQIYQVMPNETLDDIALKLNVSVEELMKLNGINNNQNIEGSIIIVPNSNDLTYEKYIVKKGDSIYSIARSHGVDYQSLLRINGLDEGDYIYPNQEIIIPSGRYEVYVVKEGDTINSISNNLGKNAMELISINKDIYLLPDQVIKY